MTRTTKGDLLPKPRESYARRQRERKTRMLDEVCEDCGYERTYGCMTRGAPSDRRIQIQ